MPKKDMLHKRLSCFSHQTRWHHFTQILSYTNWKAGGEITLALLDKSKDLINKLGRS